MVEQVLMKEIGRYRYSGEKGLAILGTTAAIAPFIGLFGTVWGIFHALHSIGESGQAGLSQVAGPVGEALIMTGLGLAVAIPAVIFITSPFVLIAAPYLLPMTPLMVYSVTQLSL
nr:MotA/TolQ/ExbB proton channel family protein [Psychrobacter sp. PraFG1]